MDKNIINEKMAILDFGYEYCKNETEVLNSAVFKRILSNFINYNIKHNRTNYIHLVELVDNIDDLIILFKLIYSFDYDSLINIHNKYGTFLNNRETLYRFVEDLYNYWRRLERYSIIESKRFNEGIASLNFIEASYNFSNVILKTYRTISEKIYGHSFDIYRQLAAGINASLLVTKYEWNISNDYKFLNNISMIEKVMIRPPFMSYSKKNKRTGTYKELSSNPLLNININYDDYLCYPCYVGTSLAFVYFNKHFMSHGITISNLFEFANLNNLKDKKPDLIYLFGYGNNESGFYIDNINDLYIGIAPLSDDVDYFGYMKKMLLTLYNTKMIKEGYLPIHGACVNVTFKDGINKTVVIIGDSGAGKSETLEALTKLAGDDIINMTTIFDDMGTFKLVNNEIVAYGTEIGAFVRLDDMDKDYAYKEMDRAIFMNPHATNSRLVIPISTYSDIIKGYKVDMVLYANNYENIDDITKLNTLDEALKTFIEGKRFAKGTTGEVGLVETFFANPFGPLQYEDKTRIILDKYFKTLIDNNIYIGILYTKLAISGYEQKGPEFIAKKLFTLLRGI